MIELNEKPVADHVFFHSHGPKQESAHATIVGADETEAKARNHEKTFKKELGRIPENASVHVKTTLKGKIDRAEPSRNIQYTLPASWIPCYDKYPGVVAQPNAWPPRGMRIIVDMNMPGTAIQEISCAAPSHILRVRTGRLFNDLSSTALDSSKAFVFLDSPTPELGSDLVLAPLLDDDAPPQHTSIAEPVQLEMSSNTDHSPKPSQKACVPESYDDSSMKTMPEDVKQEDIHDSHCASSCSGSSDLASSVQNRIETLDLVAQNCLTAKLWTPSINSYASRILTVAGTTKVGKSHFTMTKRFQVWKITSATGKR